MLSMEASVGSSSFRMGCGRWKLRTCDVGGGAWGLPLSLLVLLSVCLAVSKGKKKFNGSLLSSRQCCVKFYILTLRMF